MNKSSITFHKTPISHSYRLNSPKPLIYQTLSFSLLQAIRIYWNQMFSITLAAELRLIGPDNTTETITLSNSFAVSLLISANINYILTYQLTPNISNHPSSLHRFRPIIHPWHLSSSYSYSSYFNQRSKIQTKIHNEKNLFHPSALPKTALLLDEQPSTFPRLMSDE